MTIAVSILPSQQLEALNEGYRKAVARKRLRFTLGAAAFFAALVIASIGATWRHGLRDGVTDDGVVVEKNVAKVR